MLNSADEYINADWTAVHMKLCTHYFPAWSLGSTDNHFQNKMPALYKEMHFIKHQESDLFIFFSHTAPV